MSTKIRECVKGLSQNRDVKELLPEYIKQSMEIHDSYARLKLMMEYYIFYEMISEGINPYIDSAEDTAECLHQVISQVFGKDAQAFCGEKWRGLGEILEKLRQEVTEKMQVLTAYVDQFVVYEYILNRVQYRFEDQEVIAEDSVFAQEVLNFIFATRDNMAINDNIRAVIGQLPMRMTRSHYFDLIRDSISVYKGSDVSSLEGYLYMFRTNAMLYRTPAMEEHFTEFVPVLQELAQLDYDNMTEELYQIYAEKIRVNASRLNDISDLYMLLQQLINEVYSVVLAAPYCQGNDRVAAADTVIRGINALFLKQESDIWQGAGEEIPETDEEKLHWLGEHFPAIEGQQEKIYEAMNMADAMLEETREAQRAVIDELQLADAFVVLEKLQQLASNSAFAGLEVVTEEEKVSDEKAEQAAQELVAELKDAFKGQSRMVRRAIMANTLEKIPVFFTTPQEVADYISQSLQLCEDEAEKYASKQLIQSLME
ncbi:MAG: hypothetical protein J5979_01410 [Lachnospiraceae bacterium]|nr:hypothetical protein [Lachnospiraceae bacterium]